VRAAGRPGGRAARAAEEILVQVAARLGGILLEQGHIVGAACEEECRGQSRDATAHNDDVCHPLSFVPVRAGPVRSATVPPSGTESSLPGREGAAHQ
jgi:hypothetical protein